MIAAADRANTRNPDRRTNSDNTHRRVSPELREVMQRIRLQEIEDTTDEFAAAVGGRHPDLEAAAVLTAACANYAALTYSIEGGERDVDDILEALRRAIVALVAPHLAQDSSR